MRFLNDHTCRVTWHFRARFFRVQRKATRKQASPESNARKTAIWHVLRHMYKSLQRRAALLVLLGAGLSTFAISAIAQNGVFVSTGSMSTSRVGHTATLLKNGKVLVTGGYNGTVSVGENSFDTTLSSAELYDPATGIFTATGSMTTPRGSHTATLLNNGKVLIAGGGVWLSNGTFQGALQSAELYDPTTGTFTPTGSMVSARYDHTATLLKNGEVLIAGDFNGNSLTSAELYDPATGTFIPTGSMVNARYSYRATLLNSGMVLITGGNLNGSAGDPADLYDLIPGTFMSTSDMIDSRIGHTATLLNNGNVLVWGGTLHAAPYELYDAATGTFVMGAVTGGLHDHTATLLNSGWVLLAGGTFEGSALSSAAVYEPDPDFFEPTNGSMSIGRTEHTATLLDNGLVLVAGGIFDGLPLASADLYVPFRFFPMSLSFSNQLMGTTSAFQTVTLTNDGSPAAALGVSGVTIGGTNASDFAENTNCVGTVAAGANCTINVTFTPAATGTRTGILVIATSLIGNSLSVPLTGNLVAATQIASLSASSLTFPSQIVGATSPAQGVTFNNTGNAPLVISGLAFTGTNASEFAQSGNCGGIVAPGASCTVNIRFVPAGSGTRTATLTFMDGATSSPNPQTVMVTGMGQDFSVTPNPSQVVTVSPGQIASYPLAVTPTGGFNGSVTFTCSGGPALSTCALSPNPVVLNGSTPAEVTVTVTTKAALPPATIPSLRGGYQPLFLITVILVLSLLTGFRVRHEDQRPRLVYGLAMLLYLFGGMMMSACGSGGGGGGNPGTPTSYTLVVSGTFSSSSTTLTHESQLTLVVQ